MKMSEPYPWVRASRFRWRIQNLRVSESLWRDAAIAASDFSPAFMVFEKIAQPRSLTADDQ
jgi:hypothetical protein